MGIKVRRKASLHRDYKGDYLDVPSRPYLMKILQKQGKTKLRVLLITNFAIYLVDFETDSHKRCIALAAVEKVCLSELCDNFFAIIIPTEYDILMASTRKTEVVTVLVEASKSSEGIDMVFSNRFEDHAAAELVTVHFEEVEVLSHHIHSNDSSIDDFFFSNFAYSNIWLWVVLILYTPYSFDSCLFQAALKQEL